MPYCARKPGRVGVQPIMSARGTRGWRSALRSKPIIPAIGQKYIDISIFFAYRVFYHGKSEMNNEFNSSLRRSPPNEPDKPGSGFVQENRAGILAPKRRKSFSHGIFWDHPLRSLARQVNIVTPYRTALAGKLIPNILGFAAFPPLDKAVVLVLDETDPRW